MADRDVGAGSIGCGIGAGLVWPRRLALNAVKPNDVAAWLSDVGLCVARPNLRGGCVTGLRAFLSPGCCFRVGRPRPTPANPDMQLAPATGWCHGIAHCPSPNFNARPDGEVVSLLVIHNISLPPGQFGTRKVQEFFQNCLCADEHPY